MTPVIKGRPDITIREEHFLIAKEIGSLEGFGRRITRVYLTTGGLELRKCFVWDDVY